jgi:ankyrin repeat protein
LELLGYLGKHWFRYLPRYTLKDGKSAIFEARLRILKDEATLLEDRLRSSEKAFDLTNYAQVGTPNRSAVACEEFIDPWFLSGGHHDSLVDVLRTGTSFLAVNDDYFEDKNRGKIMVSSIDSRLPVNPQAFQQLERITLMSEPSIEEEFSRIANMEANPIVRWQQDTVDPTPKIMISHTTWTIRTNHPDLNRIRRTRSIRESIQCRLGSVKEFSISGREGEYVNSVPASGITSSEAYEILTRLFGPSKRPDHQHWIFEDLQKDFPRRQTVVYPLELCKLGISVGCSRCGLPPLRNSFRKHGTLRTLFVEELAEDSFGNSGFHYAVGLEHNDNNVVGWMKTLPWDDINDLKRNVLYTNDSHQPFLFALHPGGFDFCMDKLSELLHFVRLQQPDFDFNHQDSHGQTWLHQLLNNNDWSFRTWTYPSDRLTESDNIFAIEVLRLCKNFGINPYIRDNFNRTVLQFLEKNAGDELSGSNEPGNCNSLSDIEDVLKPYMLVHWAEHAATYVCNWTSWLEAVSSDNHVLDNIVLAVSLADFTSLGFYDTEGNTILLAFIAYIDPCTMLVKHVERTLETILQRLPRTDMRNTAGETPLQLASRLGLPHVVAMLLRHGASLAVEKYDGTSLPTDLRTAYRKARESDEPNAAFLEADLMICTCIIVNAANGDLPDPDHEFRPLRVFYREADDAFEGRKAPKKRLHDTTFPRSPPSLSERSYE